MVMSKTAPKSNIHSTLPTSFSFFNNPKRNHHIQTQKMQPPRLISDGQNTKAIYTLIKDSRYQQAINHLNYKLQFCPRSRSMSLLAYCYYMSQDYSNAARVYEQLVKYYPEVTEYKLYLAESHYKNGEFDEAAKVAQSINDNQNNQKLILLQMLIKYSQDDIQHAKAFLPQADQNDPNIIINGGCILFKEGKYEEARLKFQQALSRGSYSPELVYNIALCYYKMKQLAPSLKHASDIIEKGVREHPQLGVGSNSPGIEVKSVGNSQALKQSALIEAFNLKAAIHYTLKSFTQAKDDLYDMPPRSEQELDSVSLMNQALINIQQDPNGSFKKLNFLIQNPPFPSEAFTNLLLLYCKFGYFDMAADILAENSELTYKMPNQQQLQFIDAIILSKAAPQQALKRLEVIADRSINFFRQSTKNIQDCRLNGDNDGIRKYLKQFDQCVQKYIPILMFQGKIYWDAGNYGMVEKLLRQSAEFCADHETWKLNIAHVFFALGDRFKEAIKYYQPFVRRNFGNLLGLTAIVVANLCVSYVMVGLNEEAEDLMRRLEVEEEEKEREEKPVNHYHLCITNLVIGTLYCSKSNYEFGIGRIIKSMEPFNKKINTDTWFYVKRCFLSLIELLAKHMMMLKDSTMSEIIQFLELAEVEGKKIPTVINPLEELDEWQTVSYEARELKRMFLKLK